MKITMIDSVKYRVSLHKVDFLVYGKEYDLDEVDCKNLIGSGKAKLSSYIEKEKEEIAKELVEEKPAIAPMETKVIAPKVKKKRKYAKRDK